MAPHTKAGEKYETEDGNVNRLHTNATYRKDVAKSIAEDAGTADVVWLGEDHDITVRDENYNLLAEMSDYYKANGQAADFAVELRSDYKPLFDRLNASEFKSVSDFAKAYLEFSEQLDGYKIDRMYSYKQSKAFWHIHENQQNIYCLDESNAARTARKTNPDNIAKAADNPNSGFLNTDAAREQTIANNVVSHHVEGRKLVVFSGAMHDVENADYDQPDTAFAEKSAARRVAQQRGAGAVYSVYLTRMDDPDFPSDNMPKTSDLPAEMQTGSDPDQYWDAFYML